MVNNNYNSAFLITKIFFCFLANKPVVFLIQNCTVKVKIAFIEIHLKDKTDLK